MSGAADYFTLLGPDEAGRFGVVRCADDEAKAPKIAWDEDAARAWQAVRVPEGAAWVASARLAQALGQSTTHVSAPTDPQALVLFKALQVAAPAFERMGMRDADEGVSLLRALAHLKSKAHLLQDNRSIPTRIRAKTPTGPLDTHAVISRAGETVNIYVAPNAEQLRVLYEFGLSEAALPDFNILHAGFETSDDWATHLVAEITGDAFVPQVFEYQNQNTAPLSGGTGCFMLALAYAFAGYLENGPGARVGSQTARGLYVIKIDPITL